MDKIVLLGAGGHAKVVADCLSGRILAFSDNKVNEFLGLEKVEELNVSTAIISFGAVTPEGLERRHGVYNKYKQGGTEFVKAIHESAIISANTKIGLGTMVGPGAIINSGAVIGENVIINSGAIVEHDAIIGAGSHIAPGAIILGAAKIGETSMIGAGAIILPGTELANNSFIKAGQRC